MIKELLYLVVFFIVILSLSQTILLGSYFIGKQKEVGNMVKNAAINTYPSIYQNALNSSIYYNGQYTKTNKVDIITANHISTVDFMAITGIIRQFDDRNIYILIKKQLTMTPGVGFILLSNLDIKLNRKIEEDVDNITKTLSKIDSGIILIMPEGTRYTPEKQEAAKKFSHDNKLDVFKNTLYPKMKGLWTICDVLKKNNKLGNVIDISILIENYRNKQIFLSDILNKKKPFGNTFGIVNSYSYPNNIISYDDFKNWFIQIWKVKDNTLTEMSTDTIYYNKLNTSISNSNYILLTLTISLFLYLNINTNGMYLIYSLIASYLIIFIKYRKI
jgi:1-acyl-sn-glycerol-3-phosphate acyltransferase